MSYTYPLQQFNVVYLDDKTKQPLAVINPMLVTPEITIQPSNFVIKQQPSYPLLPENNLNLDPSVHKSVTNSIYRKVFESWIYKGDFKDLFKYITVINGQVKLNTKYTKNTHSDITEKKIDFMKDKILSIHRVKHILQEYVDGTKSNWYDIDKEDFFVKDLIYRYMKKKLKKLVELKNK